LDQQAEMTARAAGLHEDVERRAKHQVIMTSFGTQGSANTHEATHPAQKLGGDYCESKEKGQ
jgi:hypothetical protein